MIPEDWLVVPEHGRGLSCTHEYNYVRETSTKAVPQSFVGVLNVSTPTADDELEHGGFNGNGRSMSVQNMDTRQVKLSHDCGIENDQFNVMSVTTLVVDQETDIQVRWDPIAPVSAAKRMHGLLLLMVHTISISKLPEWV